MDEHSYLASLKDKEFRILEKLCNNSISQTDKEKFEKELEETRLEIEKLGQVLLTKWMCHICLKRGKMKKIERLHLCTSCFDKVTKLLKTKSPSTSKSLVK